VQPKLSNSFIVRDQRCQAIAMASFWGKRWVGEGGMDGGWMCWLSFPVGLFIKIKSNKGTVRPESVLRMLLFF
jgi:hypothetical protein